MYNLVVRAYDLGMPSLHSDVPVRIEIIEEGNNPPKVANTEISVMSFKDSFPGGIIGKVDAVDEDIFDELTYEIISSNKNIVTEFLTISSDIPTMSTLTIPKLSNLPSDTLIFKEYFPGSMFVNAIIRPSYLSTSNKFLLDEIISYVSSSKMSSSTASTFIV
jgi:hypothetical protein